MPFNRILNCYFFTATILNWNKLLNSDERKMVVINQLQFMKAEQRVSISSYVVMPNHVHIIWSTELDKMKTQGTLLKRTSKTLLETIAPVEKQMHYVNAKDRQYQIWERNPLWIACFNMDVLQQKLNYIHNNPCTNKWQLCNQPSDYRFSSAGYYATGIDEFGILSIIYD